MMCKYCGWELKVCETSGKAMDCDLNLENVRKFCLRFKNEPRPGIVYSRRFQDQEKGKGDSYEFLERVE